MRLLWPSAKNEDDAVDDAGTSLSAEGTHTFNLPNGTSLNLSASPHGHTAFTGGTAEGDDVDVVVTHDPP
ncbi:hypothetical protein LZ32DRAFT_32301 [Colletotrichum eremochloae]|nr:hypothetical protein LZ32DRAFT_32301 [Colletotrichum eremochloae]